MVLVEANKLKELLTFRFIHHVTREELHARREDAQALLAELSPGFRLLTDLSQLESMDADCTKEIGWMMEQCDAKGLGMVVRVIPDPSKDIGLNILGAFHYHHKIHAITCETIEQAAKILGL